jgi:hypothetical protein
VVYEEKLRNAGGSIALGKQPIQKLASYHAKEDESSGDCLFYVAEETGIYKRPASLGPRKLSFNPKYETLPSTH